MRYAFLCFTLFIAAYVLGQDFPTYNYLQEDMQQQSCPYDSTVNIVKPVHWEVYQTLDNSWNGTIDSTRCLGFRETMSGDWTLDLATTDPNKALFFRYQANEEILPNSVYIHEASFLTEADIQQEGECADEFCSGLIIDYLVYDAFRDSMIHRQHLPPIIHERDVNSTCFVTDNVELIMLANYILKFTFSNDTWSNETFTPFNFSTEKHYFEPQAITALPFPDWSWTSDSTLEAWINNLRDINDASSYLIQQRTDTFPDENHFTYVEAFPDFPIDRPLQLYVRIELASQLLRQPFTALRGGLVDGSDSIRHHLFVSTEWLTEGCDPLPMELPIPGSTTYLFKGGTLEFGGPQGCLMLFDGGAIAIEAEVDFTYGPRGVGLLGLGKDALISLAENSSMLIDNEVVLASANQGDNPQAYVDLMPGSKLVFGPHSKLRRYHTDSGMFLNIRMLGGTIDDSALSVEERSLIRRVYPFVSLSHTITAKVAPNPIQAQNQLFVATKSEVPLPYQLLSMDGLVIAEGVATPLGPQRFAWQLPTNVPVGIYFLHANTLEGPINVLFMIP